MPSKLGLAWADAPEDGKVGEDDGDAATEANRLAGATHGLRELMGLEFASNKFNHFQVRYAPARALGRPLVFLTETKSKKPKDLCVLRTDSPSFPRTVLPPTIYELSKVYFASFWEGRAVQQGVPKQHGLFDPANLQALVEKMGWMSATSWYSEFKGVEQLVCPTA